MSYLSRSLRAPGRLRWAPHASSAKRRGGVKPVVEALEDRCVPAAPVVAVSNALVTVNEGNSAVNAGTFSDADGNSTVTLTASLGSVTQNNAAGTWSWSFTSADGPDQSQTVTITATDAQNQSATKTFQLVVNNVAPAIQGGDPLAVTGNLLHRYDLNGTLADQVSGPTLAAHGGSLGPSRYTFAANQGLQLDGGLANPAHYSIELVMEYNSAAPHWKKFIDFARLSSDNGLYVSGSTITLYPGASGGGVVTPNTDFHVVLTRNSVTGEAKTYLNGVLQQTYANGLANVAVSPTNTLIFFEDDNATGRSEAQAGSVDYIAIYDGPLSAADVATLAQASGNGPPLVSVDEGQTATMHGTFNDPGNDTVTVTASVGVISQDAGNHGGWTWSFVAPDGPSASQTVVVTAADSDGGSTSTSFLLTVANVAPTVAADQAAVTVSEGQAAHNTGIFGDPGLDTVTLSASVGAISDDDAGNWSWTFDSEDGPEQTQTVTITATDSDGAVTTTTFELVVTNSPPTVAADAASITVDEGQTASNTGTFGDPGLDTVTLTASIGTVVDHGGGHWSWSFTTDDGPAQSQTVTITATDSDGAVSSTTFALAVNNVAPVITSFSSNLAPGDTVSTGAPVTVNGAFTDPGTADTHHAVIAWGDGSQTPIGESDAGIDQAAGTFTAAHAYAAAGIYTVTATLYDNDGGADESTATVLVSGVVVREGVLHVIGTSGADHVSINRQGNGLLKVHANFLPQGKFAVFSLAGVTKIVAQLGGGDDHLNIAGNLALPAFVHGGAGNDHLHGGGGPSVLLGDAGNDFLNGGGGRDILIGGTGRDKLVGGGRDDVLIGGSTNRDDDLHALESALLAWNSGGSFGVRRAMITSLLSVLDDNEKDRLNGRSKRDLVFRGNGDSVM